MREMAKLTLKAPSLKLCALGQGLAGVGLLAYILSPQGVVLVDTVSSRGC